MAGDGAGERRGVQTKCSISRLGEWREVVYSREWEVKEREQERGIEEGNLLWGHTSSFEMYNGKLDTAVCCPLENCGDLDPQGHTETYLDISSG